MSKPTQIVLPLLQRPQATLESFVTGPNAEAVAASVTTLEKLLQVWPEIESFTQDSAKADKPVVALAVPIHDLNKALKLPPKAKAKA